MSRRIIVAFLLSPLVGALYLAALDVPISDTLGFAVMIVLYAIIGYVAECVFGLPFLKLFYRFGWLKLRWFLAGGLVIGLIIALPFFFIVFFTGGIFRALAFGSLYCVAPAVLSTAVFWCVGWAADNKSLDRSGGSVFRN
jgi:hypothetical protein